MCRRSLAVLLFLATAAITTAAERVSSRDFTWPGIASPPGSFEQSLRDEVFPLTREMIDRTWSPSGDVARAAFNFRLAEDKPIYFDAPPSVDHYVLRR